MVASSAAALVIRDALPQDFSPVTNMLTAALAGSAVACWLDPDERRRRLTVLTYIGDLVRRTIAFGIARVAEDGNEIVGAAMWSVNSGTGRAVGASPASGGADRALTEVHRRRQQLDRLMDDRRPRDVACQQLVCLGVRPDRQGQGIGGCLLISHHAFLHVTGTPGYLVALDDCLQDWFEQHGYSAMGRPQLLTTGFLMQAMWRPPIPADQAA
jgi:GNAT superfamily N-acetyltransferase